MNGDLKQIPTRPDGSFKAFWYDDGHVCHLRKDGSIIAFNHLGCDHVLRGPQ